MLDSAELASPLGVKFGGNVLFEARIPGIFYYGGPEG
jgi:hypothetical protein